MRNIWKLATILLLFICLFLVYILVDKQENSSTENGLVSLNEKVKAEAEYNKLQNPIFGADNNDYFYQNPTTIEFLMNEYDFDTIPKNKVITREIKFINSGKNPYFITDIKVSCGCTIPSYDTKPIQAGDTGTVKIEYNSAKKSGFNMNKLSIFGNTEPKEKPVYFKIYVKSN
ncbi:MAG: DUF1573 domain-containing protein [Chitinophagales bacterium]|nr:DUF1573 domain-containing protein [Chitinophagales bacterium]